MPATSKNDLKKQIAELRSLGITLKEISERLECSISTVSKYKDYQPDDPEAEEELPIETEVSGDKMVAKGVSNAYIETPEQAIAFAKLDPNAWYPDRIHCKPYQLGYVASEVRTVDKETGTTTTTRKAGRKQLYSVSINFKRVLPKTLLDAAEAIYDRFAAIAPKRFPKPASKHAGRPVMACFDLFDVHFGKLAWAPETGNNYDLEIAERLYRTAFRSLVEDVKHYRIAKAVIAVGNDYLHVDNAARQTTAGTPMDTDGRLHKIVDVATAAKISAIEYLLNHCDEIEVLYVGGNHDRLTSYFVCRETKAYFRNCERVKVDVSPIMRKRIHWGSNLIAFTHGDGLRDPRSLPTVMATEWPNEWAASTTREWHLGHLHTSKRFVTKDMDEAFGVRMRWLSALSGTDAWHYENGYVGNRRAAEVYVYDNETGYKGHFVAGGE